MPGTPYRIVADRSRRLLTLEFDTIFWDMAVARQFMQDCIAAVETLECEPGEHVILVDLRNAVIQSRDIYEKMQGLVAQARAARIALVAAAPLARMQTKRLQIRDNVVLFADMAEAEAWLFPDDRAAA